MKLEEIERGFKIVLFCVAVVSNHAVLMLPPNAGLP